MKDMDDAIALDAFKPTKELILLAKGDSRKHCPFDTEVWGLNNVFLKPEVKGKRIDKLFAFDPLEADYISAMKQVAPIISWQDYADEKYPLDEIVKEFGTEFFTNTICYMIALAIHQSYDKLKIYGVDMPIGSEYINEKGGIEYWLGVAQDRGIKLEIAPGSQLLRTVNGQIYGKRDDNYIMLYLWERFALLGLLPKVGNIEIVKLIRPVKVLLEFTDVEVVRHGIQIRPVGTGQMSFQCSAEHSQPFYLGEKICKMITDSLVKLEQASNLPVNYLALYEKFVSSRRLETERGEE